MPLFSFREELFPRTPIIVGPAFAHALVIVGWHADVHEINLISARDFTERQHQDGPVFFLPMACAPHLHNLFPWYKKQVLAFQLFSKRREFPSHLPADPCRSAG